MKRKEKKKYQTHCMINRPLVTSWKSVKKAKMYYVFIASVLEMSQKSI